MLSTNKSAVGIPLSLLLAAGICLLTAATATAGGTGHAVVSVLDIEASSDHRNEAEYWYGQIVEAVDSVTGISARRDPIPGASTLPHRDFEQDLAEIERVHAAAQSTLRAGRWLSAVRLSEEALTLASKFDTPPLPGTLVRDLHLLQSRALLAGERTVAARAAMKTAMEFDPYWQPGARCLKPRVRDLFDELRDAAIDSPSGTLAVVSKQRDTQIMVHGVTQGWINRRQFSMALPVGEYKVTSRGTGFADRTDQVIVRANQRTALLVKLRKGSSSAFYPSLMQALARPSEQRKSNVWRELDSARATLASDSILAARYGDGSGHFDGLVVALYLPGREGWSFYRRIPLSHDLARDSLQIAKLREDIVMAVDKHLSDQIARR